LDNIKRTATDSNGIESYAIYWIYSVRGNPGRYWFGVVGVVSSLCGSQVLDYWMATGDDATLTGFISNIQGKLEHAWALWDNPNDLTFFGWWVVCGPSAYVLWLSCSCLVFENTRSAFSDHCNGCLLYRDDRTGSGFQNASCWQSQWDYRMLSIRAWTEFAGAMRMLNQARSLFGSQNSHVSCRMLQPAIADHFTEYAQSATLKVYQTVLRRCGINVMLMTFDDCWLAAG
jgi:hypothetical protein